MVVARRLQAASPRWFFDPLEARTGRSECGPDAPAEHPELAGVIVERTWYSHGQNQGKQRR